MTSAPKFGTDGIRLAADAFTPAFLAAVLDGLISYAGRRSPIRLLIGGDTRISTKRILSDLSRLAEARGMVCESIGVLPTPAINFYLSAAGYDFAIDVTASHNPYTYNGIKVFEPGGKLSTAGRATIETALAGADLSAPAASSAETSVSATKTDAHLAGADAAAPEGTSSAAARAAYIKHLRDYLGACDLGGARIALDCANGATASVGASVFTGLGAEVTLINADPSFGEKINAHCGSTDLAALRETVLTNRLDYGIAFDGDGDRCLMVDDRGETVDGDKILALLAEYLELNAIVATIMANQGLFSWAKEHNVALEITDVGDQNVYARMGEKGIKIGGEQSGHIILPGEPMGDGMLTGLMMAKMAGEFGKSLSELASVIPTYPQVMLNIPATPEQKSRLPEAAALLADYEQKLAEKDGRLLVRPSGTEDLIRITLWGKDNAEITALSEEIASKLKETL